MDPTPATESPEEAPVEEKAPAAPLRLQDLDRFLTPVRRTLRWGTEPGHALRFVEGTFSRWLELALALELPEAVAEPIREMLSLLVGVDAIDADERQERLIAMGVLLTRLDAFVGLPLPGGPKLERHKKPRVRRGRSAKDEPSAEGESSAPRERKSRRRRGGRSKKTSAPEKEPEVVVEVELPEWQLSDEPRPLSDVLDPDLVEPIVAAGITDLHSLVLRQPVDVEVVRPIFGAGRPVEPGRRALGGRVRSRCTRISPDGTQSTEVVLHGAGPVVAVWDGCPQRALARLAIDSRGVLVGRYEGGKLFEPEVAVEDGKKSARLARYGVPGLPDPVMREALGQVAPYIDVLRDPLPRRVLRPGGLPELGEALSDMHFRAHAKDSARRRLAFTEALALWVARGKERFAGSRRRGIPHTVHHALVARMGQFLDFDTTDEQQLVLEEVKRDLASPQPMLRLLTGDTGAGKGVVALAAAIHVAEGKGQVLFDLPDAVSAEYRFLFAEPILRELGLVARLIHGKPSQGQRDALRRGEVHVLFGHGLLEAELEFRRLGLVVGLEHDAPGSTAAKVLERKAPFPDTLVMSTSQIPGESLFAHYAEHDLSVLPMSKRADMNVQVLPSSQRAVAYASAASALEKGQQVTVIFPLVGGEDALEPRELARVKSALEGDAFPGSRVAMFHGSMARDERHAIYEDFRRHRYDVLVSTGPFEMGPPVSRASVTIVEQADRMDPVRLQRACRHLSKSSVESVRAFFVTGDVPDPVGVVRAERVASRGDELQLVRELREGSLPEPPSTSFLDIRRDRELVLAAHHLVHASARKDSTLRQSPIGDALGDIELVWRMRHPGESLDLPSGKPGARRRRRRRKRKS
ncbi:MAG: hypothetical protein KC912_01630 [Proteobacteria bacterium]|nr:hypothetical protein [Pseudomonadota bacterium]